MKRPADILFPEFTEAKEIGICPFCKNDIVMDTFRDDVSKREYKISGLCQKCQDEIWKE